MVKSENTMFNDAMTLGAGRKAAVESITQQWQGLCENLTRRVASYLLEEEALAFIEAEPFLGTVIRADYVQEGLDAISLWQTANHPQNLESGYRGAFEAHHLDELLQLKNETFYYVYSICRDQGFSREGALSMACRWFNPGDMLHGVAPVMFMRKSGVTIPREVALAVSLDENPTTLNNLLCHAGRKRDVASQLKAVLFMMIARGQLVDAAPPGEQNKYIALLTKLCEGLFTVIYVIGSIIMQLLQFVVSIGERYQSLPLELQAVLDLTVLVTVVWVVSRAVAQPQYTIATHKRQEPNRFIGTRNTDKGVVYEVIVDGKLRLLPAVISGEEEHVEEMSMPGSDYYPSSRRPVGAILVSTESVELHVFGVFWRHEDYFVTARHVANGLDSGNANIYCASIKETPKGNFVVGDVVPIERSFFDLSTNLVGDLTLDAFVKKMEPKLWAKVKVQKASTKLHSLYRQQVSAVGFADKGLLVTATGSTLEGSGAVHLWHTASTRKGFSGAPLFCGSSVVGMHIASSSGKNVAIRIEALVDSFRKEDEADGCYPGSSNERVAADVKFRGRSANLEEISDGRYAILARDGQVSYGWEEDDIRSHFRNLWDRDEKDLDQEEDEAWERRKSTRHQYFHDECNPPREVKEHEAYRVLPRERPGKGPQNPKPEPRVVEYLEGESESLKRLSYEPDKFVWPEMTPAVELNSLKKHLELFHERSKAVTEPPTKTEMNRCVGLVSEMLSANRWEPDLDYRSRPAIERIVNSSICKPGKSAGYPHCANGMPNNEAVLRTLGVGGLAQMTLNEWDEPFDLKVFLKAEPTKAKKIENGMPRIIVGLPVHKLLKHASIFKNFATALSENWESSPVKFGFVPGNPGNLESMAHWLGKGEVVGSDKGAWDYMFHQYVFDACKRVTQELCSQPLDMGDEEFAQFLEEISKAVDEVSKDSRYRCSDGTILQPRIDGRMKSGWFMTIAFNSIAQIVAHVLIMIRMGYTNEEILKMPIVAGGDDVLQKLPGVDLEEYRAEGRKMGILIDSFDVRSGFDDSEFFSHEFSRDPETGVWRFKPVRFTKHVENLRRTKFEDLPQALVSHMANWRWSEKHFRFFERMYKSFRVMHPDLFQLKDLVTRRAWCNKQLGYESMDW